MIHLDNKTAQIALESEETRIKYINAEHWIGYSKAQSILNKLEDLMMHPRVCRMPSVLLVGETNNGKTVLINRFMRRYLPDIHPNGMSVYAPIIGVQAPPVPDEKRFYNAIMDSFCTPYKLNDRVENKLAQVRRIMKAAEVKILVVDEIQHVLEGTLRQQKIFLNALKYLSNDLQISLIGVGTERAFNAIQTDPQLANRFESSLLSRWSIENKEYLRLLKTFERVLPLKEASHLTETNMALKIQGLSEGTIGGISKLLKRAATTAIRLGQERITLSLLEKTDYTPLSQRKWQVRLNK